MTDCGRHCLPLSMRRGALSQLLLADNVAKVEKSNDANISQKLIFSRRRHGNTPWHIYKAA
jgi:hypothetical protein